MKKTVTCIVLIFFGVAVGAFGAWLLFQSPPSSLIFCLSIIAFGIALMVGGVLVGMGKNFWKVIEDIFYTLP